MEILTILACAFAGSAALLSAAVLLAYMLISRKGE